MKPIRSSLLISVLVISLLSGGKGFSQTKNKETSESQNNLLNKEELITNFENINQQLILLQEKVSTNSVSSNNSLIPEILIILLLIVILGINVLPFFNSFKTGISQDNLADSEYKNSEQLSNESDDTNSDSGEFNSNSSEISSNVSENKNLLLEILKKLENLPNQLTETNFSEDKNSLFKQLEKLQNQLTEVNSNISMVKNENSIATVKSLVNEILGNFSSEGLKLLNNISDIMKNYLEEFNLKNKKNPYNQNSTFATSASETDNVNISELNNKIQTLENTIDQLQVKIQSLQTDNNELKSINNNLHQDAQNKINDLNSQLQETKQENETLKNKLEEKSKTSVTESLSSEVDNFVKRFNHNLESLSQQYQVTEVSQDDDNYKQLRDGKIKDIIVKPLSTNNHFFIVELDQSCYLIPQTNLINGRNEDLTRYAFVSSGEIRRGNKFNLIKPAKVKPIGDNKWKVIEKGEISLVG